MNSENPADQFDQIRASIEANRIMLWEMRKLMTEIDVRLKHYDPHATPEQTLPATSGYQPLLPLPELLLENGNRLTGSS